MVHCLKSKQFPLLAGLHVLPAKCHLFSFVICIIFDCKSSFIYIFFKNYIAWVYFVSFGKWRVILLSPFHIISVSCAAC